VTRYGNERLGRLLQLLRPVPEAWLSRAKQILSSAPERTIAVAKPLSDEDVARLRLALESDPLFRTRFDADPVSATAEAGMGAIAIAIEYEMSELLALAERVATDHAYRAELDADPVATLAAAGIPSAGAEPLLDAFAVTDEVRAKLPEVVAHEHRQPTPRAGLLILLLGAAAAVEKIRATSRSA
jgi:hypothetical protein